MGVHFKGTSSLGLTLANLNRLIGAMSVASAAAAQGFSREFAKAIDDLAETPQFQKVQERFAEEFMVQFGPICERAITWTLTKAFKFCYNWIQRSDNLLRKGFKFCAIILVLLCLLAAGYYFGGTWGLTSAGALLTATNALLNKVFGDGLLQKGKYPAKLD